MITDRQIASSYIQIYEQGVEKKEVRSYEVSIWTLQDEFITVLKWSDVEQKGRIQDPQLTIADDGTQEFKFSIPMYLYNGEKLVENPIWYNTRNGNIAINLRKIKVIFNKQTINRKTFEFLITKVTETHEADKLTCEIECEGLAFHELGKRGYTISLSLDDYDLEYKAWLERDPSNTSERPKQNVQFWCEKIGLKPRPQDSNQILSSTQWYYKIDMNWEPIAGVNKRQSNIVYEEPFVTDWSTNNTSLVAATIEPLCEKERTIEVHESNLYNITQEIAKQFGIFCRYEYEHDRNNHIISKTVVFFNNCLHGNDNKESIIGFTYPHSSKKVSREVDSKDIVTKMYVRSMEDSSVLLGEANITYCSANKTGDDYILNFDYLKETGSLTNEQIEAIEEYEFDIYTANKELIPKQNKLAEYQRKEVDLEAKITTYQNSITLDKEQINKNSDLARSLVAEYGNPNSQYIGVFNNTHPDQGFIVDDSAGNPHINLKTKQKGIDPNSIKLYWNYSSSGLAFSNPINNFTIAYDEYSNPTAIYGVAKAPGSTSNKVYMEYSYEPRLYYENVVNTWQVKLAADQKKYNDAVEELGFVEENSSAGLKGQINQIQLDIQSALENKKEIVSKFERIMGPALREGYWQPEQYETYGKHYNDVKVLSSSKTNSEDNFENDLLVDTGDSFVVGWDSILFDEEIDLKYESGIEQGENRCPCINLNTIVENSSIYEQIHSNLFNYSFIFNNNYYQTPQENNNLANISNFSINENRGGQAVFSFIKQGQNIIPALILVGAKSMTDEQIEHMTNSAKGNPRLGILNVNVEDGTITSGINSVIELPNNCWMSGNMDIVYPRIKFSSLMLKTDPTNLFVHINNRMLEQFQDYYIRTRYDENNNYQPEYLITIKPERLAQYDSISNINIDVDYVLSNASTSIYLDALKIEKENAYPKVSYTIDPNILDKSMISTLYNKLSWIVHINDAQLKLKEAYGYISKLVLNLDFPDKDTIEVKNYTTKFEDLFSTIVAQTENMQRNEGLLNRLARGEYALSGNGLTNTLNTIEMNNYFDTYFSESNTVQETLQNLFQEAGAILSDGSNALNQVQSLSLKNSTILNGFADRVQNELIPKVFRQVEQPDDFKIGDIWLEIDSDGEIVNTYNAISDSDNSLNGHGWVKTYEGGIAGIHGALLNVDAVTGIIDMSGGQINLTTQGNESNQHYTGINMISTYYDSKTESNTTLAKIIMDPTKIEMAGAKITMFTGTQTNSASALELDGEAGIWIGSSKTISLFASDNKGNNANVEISPAHIFFGMNNTTNGNTTAAELNENYIIMTAGVANSSSAVGNVSSIASNGITIDGSLAGIEIRKDKIGLAVGSGNGRSAIIMNSSGMIIGTRENGNTPQANGSYVSISGAGVVIGSKGTLTVNTTNFKVNPIAEGTNALFYVGTGGTQANDKYIKYSPTNGLEVKGSLTATALTVGSSSSTAMSYSSDNGLTIGSGTNTLTYNNNKLTVSGEITATTLNISQGATIGGLTQISGWQIGASKLYSGQGNNYVALSSESSGTYAIWCGNETDSSGKFRVTRSGSVYINQLMVKDTKNSNNQWEINPSGTHDAQGYTPIDFSNLNFKQAIALSLQCSGTSISSTANFWGHFNTSLSRSASATCSAAAASSQNAFGAGYTNISINCGAAGSLAFNNVYVDCSTIATNAASGVISSVNTTAEGCGYDNGEVKYITSVTMTNAGSYTVATDTYNVSQAENNAYRRGWNDFHDACNGAWYWDNDGDAQWRYTIPSKR